MALVPARSRITFPLDVSDLSEATRWVELLSPHVGIFKVGLELFTAVGPRSIQMVKERGAKVFLDLKLHDIPNTMAHAAASAAQLEVDYLTVHAMAGPEALERVREATEKSAMRVLAVAVLTSSSAETLARVGFGKSPQDLTQNLVSLTRDCGLSGIVCAPTEVRAVKTTWPECFAVTPGIRSSDAPPDDQKLVLSAFDAISEGADLLVVGRPIRNAQDPTRQAGLIKQDIERALGHA